ncbi:bleomycin hydrolase [Coemansia javaensis]|uniref:Cysteine proteinase 1, mitochondrial n=1 Tax=Coemansia javaensis TaxID=2761396 RepID=A0A9W8H3A2_9FUNG|nr:bleomycin hydrolase [Coemansia javaensis]
MADGASQITMSQLKSYSAKDQLAHPAISSGSYKKLTKNRKVAVNHPAVFSDELDMKAPVTDQKGTGRCWIFAGLNMMRHNMVERYNNTKIELSASYVFFYDQLEKCNWFLESVLRTVDDEADSTLVRHMFREPLSDGGQWDMFAAVVEKYGVVPKEAYPETHHSEGTWELSGLLKKRMRENGMRLRKSHRAGASIEELRAQKQAMVEEAHRILAIMMGTPPDRVTWSFYDKDDKLHVYPDITPLEFYREHAGVNCSDIVSLVDDPRNKYYELLEVDYLGNVVDGPAVRYINVPVEDIKRYAIKVLKAGRPVWFGCDVEQSLLNSEGLMALDAYNLSAAFDIEATMTKRERLQYGESTITHAMVITGVHLEDGKSVRWRIENSWGSKAGDGGYYTMTDEWFSEFVYQISIEKRDIPDAVLRVLDQQPVTLPPWDPLGALLCGQK